MKFQSFVFFFFVTFLFQGSISRGDGGSIISNGGDPLFEFMEAARTSFVETLRLLQANETEVQKFCKSTKLSATQENYCQKYVSEVLSSLIELNFGPSKVRFVLRHEPLLVKGPDGKPMAVAGRTILGRQGPIELHRDSVKTFSPVQVLFLLAHEFQHKILFEGEWMDDNSPRGPFLQGRDFLDFIAGQVVALARRQGKVGSQFGLRDIFDCRVNYQGSQFGGRYSSSRLFQSEDMMSYQTSLGRSPTDGSLYVFDSTGATLRLRFDIFEPNNCQTNSSSRRTSIQIVREWSTANGTIEELILAETKLDKNPICNKDGTPLTISWEQLRFHCSYFGAVGITSSPSSKQ